jgi:hypothetical protein
VFRQLLVETTRLRREQKRRVVMYIITHGQCHIEPELITAIKQQAFVYGVIVLPSSDQLPEFVPLLDRSQVVQADALGSRADRQRRALDILGDAGRAAPRKAPPVKAVESDPQQSRRMAKQPGESLKMPKAKG